MFTAALYHRFVSPHGLLLPADNKLLCSGSRDTSVRLWDVETGRETARNSTQLNVVTDIKWLLGPLSTVVAQVTPLFD